VSPDDPGPAEEPSPAQGTGYGAGAKAAGVLLTFVLPVIALIAALMLYGSQEDPLRRATLRAWALASGAWLAVGGLAVIIAISAISSSVPQVSHKGPCVGGPAMGSAGQPVGHGNYRFDCVDGGSTVVHFGN
jgi:hypothetical protein